MLDLDGVDLSSLCEALEDHSDETSWWLNPGTGAVEPHSTSSLGDDDLAADPEDRGLVWVDPAPSGAAYRDLEDFVARVRDRRAHDCWNVRLRGVARSAVSRTRSLSSRSFGRRGSPFMTGGWSAAPLIGSWITG